MFIFSIYAWPIQIDSESVKLLSDSHQLVLWKHYKNVLKLAYTELCQLFTIRDILF